MYLGSPSKLPIFAHGLGFVVSHDLAELLADLGLSFKLRGNDDMLVGMWLRSVEDVRFLHYHPWFHDHQEFGGLFSRPCQNDAVIVHRMTLERWRTFDKTRCHICGPARSIVEAFSLVEPLEPDVVELVGEEEEPNDVSVEELARLEQERKERNKERAFEESGALKLAVLIFGSRWQDSRLRGHLRHALSSVKHSLQAQMGSSGNADSAIEADFAWLFVMTELPMDWLRHLALREILLRRDLVTLGPARLPRLSRSAKETRKAAGASRQEQDFAARQGGCYRYEEAWRLVEERWRQADFVLLLDHRSYVNVPRLMSQMSNWPRRRLQPQLRDKA